MEKEAVILDYEYFKENCNFDDLKCAVEKLTNAAEDQFDEIKKEKWYNRLFNMVTLSQKGKIRMAEQIGSLAQAQSVLIEILVRLSANNEQVAELGRTCMEDIRRLQKNDIYLLQRINRLEDICVLGIRETEDVKKLSTLDKKILSGCLRKLSASYPKVSNYQQQYANALLNYLGLDVEPELTDISAALSQVGEESRRKMLLCIMEYMRLADPCTDITSEQDDLIEEFDLGQKTIRTIKAHIEATYNLRGADGIIDKYKRHEQETEVFYLELDHANVETRVPDNQEPVIGPTGELEEITLSENQQIPDGETCVYKNKDIHIQASIDCAGDLVFESCILHFREAESVCKITLTETASLKITGCEIEMHTANKDFLIDAKEVRKPILLENCEMKNCWNFIEVGSNCDVTMTNCVITDAGPGFIKGFHEGSGNISRCKFTFQNTAPFSAKEFSDSLSHSIIMLKKLEFKENKVRGCHRIRSETNLSWDNTTDIVKYFDCKYSVTFIAVEQCVVSCAEFYGISDCIGSRSGTINLTIFEQCNNSIRGGSDNIEIKDCLFNYCGGDTIYVLRSEVTNCQFNHCVGTVVSTLHAIYFGKQFSELKLFDCEFNDWKSYSHPILKHDCMILIACRENDNPSSYVTRCLFNGINVRNGFLIDIVLYSNGGLLVYVNDCKFLNCATGRDSGEILKRSEIYKGLLGKKKEIQVLSATNCIGLDRVNRSDGSAKQFKVKTTNAVGIPLGCSKLN